MIYCKTIKKALLHLTGDQLGYCKSCSSLVALYKRTGMRDCEERCKGKLKGFLTALILVGYINSFDGDILYEWFSSADRSKEDTE